MRLSGLNRAFRHDGLLLEAGWSLFETFTDEQRACLRDYFGTHIRVHPDDFGQLEKFGLRLQTDDEGNPNFQAPLVEINPKPAKSDKGDAKTDNQKNKADKAADKKEG